MTDHIPNLLYKYYCLLEKNKGRAMRALTQPEVYFSVREKFNDPFDCRPVVSVEGTEEEYRSMFFREIAREPELINRPQNEIETACSEFMAAHYPPRSEHHEKFEARLNSRLNSIGILCLSETCASPTMWAHYANGHKGICIAYKNLSAWLSSTELVGYEAYKVKYFEDRPVIRPMDTDLAGAEAMISVKSSDWGYEKEWRVVNFNGSGVRQLPRHFIDSVIIGANAAPSVERNVRDWLPKLSPETPRIFQARFSERSFSIEADEIKP